MVTVLMPFYNAEACLAEAIESILDQTYRDFELLMIDDGSTDGSSAIAQSYAARDGRIRLISHGNCGMGDSLNRGLRLAIHEWIARMDADDIMMPDRLEKQLDFVKSNPDVAVASSSVFYINAKGRVVGKSKSEFTTREAVRAAIGSNRTIGFAHPAVIMRKSVINSVGGYRKQFWPADDLDLWTRVTETGAMVLVQPEALLKYRIHEGSVSVAKAVFAERQVSWLKECMRARRAGLAEPTEEEFEKCQGQLSLGKKAERLRKTYAKVHYKAAVVSWANDRKITALVRLLAAGCLSPRFLITKMKTKSIC